MNIHKVYSFFMRRFRPKRLAQFKVLCPEVHLKSKHSFASWMWAALLHSLGPNWIRQPR
jgi:hypothetical protein